ncbi:Alpha/Beta hydrolase protein [Mucidula mucida]|nr:Alpha/Beta hydrolase protein [Mucidula mucida]
MRRLVEYWRTGFDWRAQEAAINAELPQFTRDIKVNGFGTLNIHYVHLVKYAGRQLLSHTLMSPEQYEIVLSICIKRLHQKSKGVDVVPLLFVHGWPSSCLEVRKMLPLLTAGNPSFHVVALSLPGFGFSEAPSKKGSRINQYAEDECAFSTTIDEQPVTQGGDLGTMITRAMALKYGSKHISFRTYRGCALTYKQWIPTAPYAPIAFLQHLLTPYTVAEKAGAQKAQWFEKQGSGYFLRNRRGLRLLDTLWRTRQSVCWPGFTKSWTDEYPWTDEEVLTWISVFLFSRAGPTASTRIYYETYQSGDIYALLPQRPSIPYGISIFMGVRPISWFTTNGNLVLSNNTHTKGGHFGAWEAPEGLVADLRRRAVRCLLLFLGEVDISVHGGLAME